MSKLKNMRAIEIPKFRALSSGIKTLDELFGPGDSFSSWVNNHRYLFKEHIYEPQDFLWHENNDTNRSTWVLAIKDEVTEADTAPYEIIEFPGGMFLVATGDENDNDDLNETIISMVDWINNNEVFEHGDLPGMCNMPNPDGAIDQALGIAQQQIYLPIKFRQK
ncbi:hypothetical protein IMSAG013_00779 [Clostridiales bacterium]|nr:hypothetical protein [Clostridiales bacterium]GFI55728.1 hypothetical protein IMSAG013_00779 [Clostridiales bacterium]